jgi:multiple sugar transport system ATP-binding protein
MRLARAGAEEIRPRVERAAKMLHIDHLPDRLPKQLSGEQGRPIR